MSGNIRGLFLATFFEVLCSPQVEYDSDRLNRTCPECCKLFSTEDVMRRHLREHDPEAEKQFSCTKCEYKCNRKDAIKSHMLRKHKMTDEEFREVAVKELGFKKFIRYSRPGEARPKSVTPRKGRGRPPKRVIEEEPAVVQQGQVVAPGMEDIRQDTYVTDPSDQPTS